MKTPTYPFDPSTLDALPEELAELFRGLEIKLLEEICSRLKIADQLNEVTAQMIRALRAQRIDLDEITRAIAETTAIGMEKLDALLDDVVERNQKYYAELINLAKVTAPASLVNERDVAAIRRQTWGAYKNITGSMGFLVSRAGRLEMLEPARAYHWALDTAALKIQSGAYSYETAIADAVRELADSGIKTVEYDKDGKKIYRQIDVAVRSAVMTGVSQISDQYDTMSMEYLNTRYCQISAHSGARDKPGPSPWSSHKSWQGLVYYESEYGEPDPLGKHPDLVESTGYGYVDGLKGVNCRHRKHAFIPGIMERTYSDHYLEHIDDGLGCEFEGKQYTAYEATQMQRQIENSLRKWKRRAAGAVTEKDKTSANIRLKRLNQKYKDFSKAAGLPLQRERTRTLYT